MKKIYFVFTLLTSVFAISQIPSGYYDSANGLTGFALKTQLNSIVTNGHNDQGYNALWTLYTNPALRDNYYENDGSLLDLYSENPSGTDPYNYSGTNQQCGSISIEGSCYNREHLVAQSFFDDTAVNPMKNDAHHVLPSDGKVNGWRNNFPFGVVDISAGTNPCNSGATNTPCYTKNGSLKGNNKNSGYSAGFSSTVFEPINEFKGDVARAFFYFVTRYETQISSFFSNPANTSEVKAMFDGTNNKAFSNTFLEILKQWHILDPVSTKEIAVNNAIYNFQGNRNPYIDHPEYVAAIWGSPLANETFSDNVFNIYPNPSNGTFKIEYDATIGDINVEVYSMVGQKVFEKQNVNDNTITTNGLQSGVYLVKIAKDSKSIVKKILIN